MKIRIEFSEGWGDDLEDIFEALKIAATYMGARAYASEFTDREIKFTLFDNPKHWVKITREESK